MLGYLLEPTNERRRGRVLYAMMHNISLRLSVSANDDKGLLIARQKLTDFCNQSLSAATKAGSADSYRNKLRFQSRDRARRQSPKVVSPEGALHQLNGKLPARLQAHLWEVLTVATGVNLMMNGKAKGNYAVASMEIVRAEMEELRIAGTYRDASGIKRAWRRKGPVAHLCFAFANFLKANDYAELTSEAFAGWAEQIESFLTQAADCQKFLLDRRNFSPNSSVPKRLLVLSLGVVK